MDEFTKSERKQLRQLAAQVYEAEAARMLEELASSFARWRSGEILPSELLQLIHEFHRDQSKQLWSMYQTLKEPDVVARGLASGLVDAGAIPETLREKLEPFTSFFRKGLSRA